ncbi:anti-sigma factor [Streptacidiphilus rugosus]|uniref:anti-sigma factor n=1 Tax=Streptacidiphilus rugosus TaxID=405783 RepID=UPI0005622E0C|nr:anti-sigma factor [Streptacidiphilus rugosus]
MNAPLNFQQRLGDELTARAAALSAPTLVATPIPVRTRPRHGRRVAVTAFGLAAAVTAVVLGAHVGGSPAPGQAAPTAKPVAGNPTPAVENASFTVTVRKGGTVALQVTGSKLSGLQSALRGAGLNAVVLNPSASCHTRVVSVGGDQLGKVMSLDPKNGRIALLTPGAVPDGETLLVVNENPANGLHKSTVGSLAYMLVKHVPSCFPASQVDIGEGYVPR